MVTQLINNYGYGSLTFYPFSICLSCHCSILQVQALIDTCAMCVIYKIMFNATHIFLIFLVSFLHSYRHHFNQTQRRPSSNV